MRRFINFASVFVFLLVFEFASANIINVPGDSSSIQGAINGANVGDTVIVAPNTYYENLTINKEILVESSGGRDVTFINGSGGNTCLTFTNNVGNSCIFRKFTMTNSIYGAGLNSGRPLIDSCKFEGLSSFPLHNAHPQEVGYYAGSDNQFILNLSGQYNAIHIRNGTISDSTNWPLLPSGMVYYLAANNDYMVSIGGASSPELLIESGNIVKLTSPQYNDVEHRFGVGIGGSGTLNAYGVYFTSYRDDDWGGDSNGGGYSSGSAGDWGSIYFNSPSSGSVLDSCFIRYGGRRI